MNEMDWGMFLWRLGTTLMLAAIMIRVFTMGDGK